MDLSKFAVSDFEVTLAEATSKKSSKRSSKDGSNLSPIEDISLPSVSGTSAEGDQRENQVDVSFIKSLDVAVTRKICTGQIVIR